MNHFVGSIKQTKYSFAIFNSRQENKKPDVHAYYIQIGSGQIKIQTEIQNYSTSINSCQKFTHMIFEV